MTIDTSKITAAAAALGDEIAAALLSLDSRVAALESEGSPPVTEPPPQPPVTDHPYQDLTTYYKFPTGSTTFPDPNTVHCSVAAGDHSSWDSSCDFAGLSGPRFAPAADIHLDYNFKIDPGDPMTGEWVLVGEIHNDDTALGRATSPPFAFHVGHDVMMIVCIAGGSTWSDDQWMWPYTDTKKLERGRDYHIQVDVKFTNDGYLKVRRDNAVLVDYHGPLGYGHTTYWMPDIYRSNTNPTVRETTAVQFSKMLVWTDDAAAISQSAENPQIRKSAMKKPPKK